MGAGSELTDEHLIGTLSGIRNSRTIYRLPKSHYYSKDALDRIVGTPANPQTSRSSQGSTNQKTVYPSTMDG